MTKNDVLKLMIQAYELGIHHGRQNEQQETEHCQEWDDLKLSAIAIVKELTTL